MNEPPLPVADLWRCPRCRRPFANVNQRHSCGRWRVEDFLRGKSARAVALYERFAALAGECGPFILAPAKTRVGFQVRMIFAAVNRLNDSGLAAHVILARRLEHPRFTKIESFSPHNHQHHFKLASLDELDDEVRAWLREAYRVGAQEHLPKKR
jgi:hypothetical protein